MNSLEQLVHTLKATKYLTAHLTDKNKLLPQKLMLNGTRFSAEIARHWWKTRFSGVSTEIQLKETQHSVHIDDRLNFIEENSFLQQLATVQNKQMKLPAIVKFAQNVPTTTASSKTQLVCLHLCTHSNAMEQFYKMQRERKIWWMRVSANPSRYYIEPFALNKDYCQSISIKSKLSTNEDNLVEHLSLVPLHKLSLRNDGAQFKLRDMSTGKVLLPTVIRTVMDLTQATYALLLDACDHKRRQTLMIHRHLVPFQCAVLAQPKSDAPLELKNFTNLYHHINKQMRDAGLRCYTDGDFLMRSREQLDEQLKYADTLGIPYVLLVDAETLKTGLLQLRSRDTTLSEVIHISDICIYLPNICTH